jgi:hypothetical protein
MDDMSDQHVTQKKNGGSTFVLPRSKRKNEKLESRNGLTQAIRA